jgi:hypothetical protein
MRSVLVLGLLMTLCTAANAATAHHAKPEVMPGNLTAGEPRSWW